MDGNPLATTISHLIESKYVYACHVRLTDKEGKLGAGFLGVPLVPFLSERQDRRKPKNRHVNWTFRFIHQGENHINLRSWGQAAREEHEDIPRHVIRKAPLWAPRRIFEMGMFQFEPNCCAKVLGIDD